MTKLSNRRLMLLMLFCRNLCEKRQFWVSEPHFGEVRGDPRRALSLQYLSCLLKLFC